jgi:hypothetical protein
VHHCDSQFKLIWELKSGRRKCIASWRWSRRSCTLRRLSAAQSDHGSPCLQLTNTRQETSVTKFNLKIKMILCTEEIAIQNWHLHSKSLAHHIQETISKKLWQAASGLSRYLHFLQFHTRSTILSECLRSHETLRNPKRRRKFHQVFFSRTRRQVVSRKSREIREKKTKITTETQFTAIVDSSLLMDIDLSETRSNLISSVLISEHWFDELVQKEKKNWYLISSFLSANNDSFQTCTLSKSLSNKETTSVRSYPPL